MTPQTPYTVTIRLKPNGRFEWIMQTKNETDFPLFSDPFDQWRRIWPWKEVTKGNFKTYEKASRDAAKHLAECFKLSVEKQMKNAFHVANTALSIEVPI